MRTLLGVLLLAPLARPDSLSGVVLGPDNLPLPRATVQAGGQRATTSRKGEYRLNLPRGSYDVTINFPNLRTFQKKSLAISGDAHLDATLDFGGQMGTAGESHEYAMNAARMIAPEGPTPRTPDGKPDLTGVWAWAFPIDPGQPHFLPSADAALRARNAQGVPSPSLFCQGHFLLWANPRVKMVQTRDVLILMYEDEEPGFRQVFLDGRPHPADPNPTWGGHAIGKWDGDTLIVDRVGFNDRNWLDAEGHSHSEKLHIVEKYRRPDLGHLEIEITVEDPDTLAAPWTMKRESILSVHDEIQEFLCAENNRYFGKVLGN